MYQLSSAVLRAITKVAKVNLLEHSEGPSQSIIEAVSGLSEMFTRNGQVGSRVYFEDPQLRAGYLVYYLPVNLAKVQILLDELQPVLPVAQDQDFRVLDLGGGPGTGVLGVLDWCLSKSARPPCTLRMIAVDRSPHVLGVSTDIWRAYSEQQRDQSIPPLNTVECNLERSLPSAIRDGGGVSGYQLIIVQNLLSELFVGSMDPVGQRTALVGELLNYLAPEGSLMLIEPATRPASRELHQVRDNLLAGQHCSVFAPCLHDAPCPALLKPDDWCHEERKWETPAWIAQVDREVGLLKDALKFSYVIFRKDGKTLVPRDPDYHRVVSELRVMKGEKRVWLCDQAGRSEIGRQDKESSSSNAAFDDWHRGAIIRVSEIVRKERKGRPAMVGRITSSGVVEIVRPA